MADDELAAKYKKQGWIDIGMYDDAGEFKAIIAALKAPGALALLNKLVEWGWQVVIEREKDGGIGLSCMGRFDVSAPTLAEAIKAAAAQCGPQPHAGEPK